VGYLPHWSGTRGNPDRARRVIYLLPTGIAKGREKMRITSAAVFVAIGLALVSCVARPPQAPIRYSKADATQEQFMKDRYECQQQAQQQISGAYVNQYGGGAGSKLVLSCGMWISCLGARGYVIDPNGNLAAPDGMQTTCQKP
jgi:hypothetical protein